MGGNPPVPPVPDSNKHMNDHIDPLFRAIIEAHTPVYGVRITSKIKTNGPNQVDTTASDSLDEDAGPDRRDDSEREGPSEVRQVQPKTQSPEEGAIS